MKSTLTPRFLPPLVALSAAAFFAGLIACSSTSTESHFGRDSAIIEKAKRYGLVHVPAKLPGVKIDLRYRTAENATGRPLYPRSMPCLLHPTAVERLSKAQRILKKQGYGILILDAWRPPETHRALWNAVQDSRWVVPPSDGLSLHCYGLAVDVTLVDADGQEVRMPSRFDEFSDRARSRYTGPDPEIRRNVTTLQNAMTAAGFRAIEDEWWHFDIPQKTRVYRVSASTLGIPLPQ